MAYPNFSVATAAQVYPTPTNGTGVPAVVTLSGTGVSQVVVRKADGAGATGGSYGSINAEQLDGQVTGSANRGVQYVAPLATNGTVQLTAGVKDAQGVVASSPNTFTFRSWNAQVLSAASFAPPLPGQQWLPNTAAPIVPAGQSGPGGGNGLIWNSKVATVNASGLVTAGTGPGFAIIETRYPLDNQGVNSNNFIAALLMVTVTAAGTDVE